MLWKSFRGGIIVSGNQPFRRHLYAAKILHAHDHVGIRCIEARGDMVELRIQDLLILAELQQLLADLVDRIVDIDIGGVRIAG